MAFTNVHSGINLLKDFPGYANGFRLTLGDGYSFCTDLSKWSITLNGKDISKQCSIYVFALNYVILYTKIPFACLAAFNAEGIYREGVIFINAPVTKIDTNVTVKSQISLNLTQHLKMLMADVRDFNTSSAVVIPTISQPSSSDLVYYNVSEDGNKVKMEIYSGAIHDLPTFFACYVPVCDSTNTTAVPSDFIINNLHGTGVRTMMGNLNLAKAIRILNDVEKEVDIVALPQDNQLVDMDGKRYMLIRFTFWYDLTGQFKNNGLQYSDSYKVYLMFEN